MGVEFNFTSTLILMHRTKLYELHIFQSNYAIGNNVHALENGIDVQ